MMASQQVCQTAAAVRVREACLLTISEKLRVMQCMRFQLAKQ